MLVIQELKLNIINFFSKIGVAEFLIESQSLNVGDNILITGPTTGVIETKVEEIRVNLKNVESCKKGEYCSIPINSLLLKPAHRPQAHHFCLALFSVILNECLDKN